MYTAAVEKGTGLFGEMTAKGEGVVCVLPTMDKLNEAYGVEKRKFPACLAAKCAHIPCGGLSLTDVFSRIVD